RADDDFLPAGQRRRQFTALAAVLAGDRRDDAGSALEVEDRILKLLVDHRAIGDHEHRVEKLLRRGVMKVGEEMRGPRDRVGLARAGRVLDEVFLPGAFGENGRLELPRRVKLVEAREYDSVDLLLVVALRDDVAAQDLKPTLALPDRFP